MMKVRLCVTSNAVRKGEIDYYYTGTVPSLIDLMTIEEEGSGVISQWPFGSEFSNEYSIFFITYPVKIQPLLRFIETGIKDEEVQQPLSEPMKELRSQTKRKAWNLFNCQE